MAVFGTTLDGSLIYVAILLYLLSCGFGLLPFRNATRYWYIGSRVLALLVHSFAIYERWIRVGHGPFLNLYEILSSNVWSISMITLATFFYLPTTRKALFFSELTIVVLVLWLFFTNAIDSHLPPTYDTIWLYFHVVTGKLFFGLLLVATSCSIESIRLGLLDKPVASSTYGELAYRFLAVAFLFESAMLLVGAIWAQDAWGRYWAWDPLETWAFITWLSVLVILHMRTAVPSIPIVWFIPIAFALAFLTFFGVPFISMAPHKGMI